MGRVTNEEQEAIRAVLRLGAQFGYGNLIAHLNTGWARALMKEWGMSEKDALAFVGERRLPPKMQEDILTSGEWDFTGLRYREESS